MKNTIYMAPMEGLTDVTFRNAYEKIFGKGKIAKYFTPFISPNKSEKFLAREIRDIDREHNNGINTVVQVMTNDAKDFIWTARMLYDAFTSSAAVWISVISCIVVSAYPTNTSVNLITIINIIRNINICFIMLCIFLFINYIVPPCI